MEASPSARAEILCCSIRGPRCPRRASAFACFRLSASPVNPIQKRLIQYAPFLCLIAYWIASEVFYAIGNRPSGISTISDYYRVLGPPVSATRYQSNSQVFYHLYGRGPHFPWILAFPSSPPVYVFDTSGRFVEWSSDPGDDPRFQQRWPFREGQKIDPAALPKPQ
jgi:hypothetical protein